jgi:arsenate reductase
MAEGLARHYGSDVLKASSAGLAPIHRVDPFSIKAMQDRNIDITTAFPKGLNEVDPTSYDLIVNMSGEKLPASAVLVEEWEIPDPISRGEEECRKTADLLEQKVMRLILQFRLKQHPALFHVRTAG